MKYKLVVSDMDGTLLDGENKISQNSFKVIKRIISSGGYFVMATGRLDTMVKSYARQIGGSSPVISCNGALVRDIISGKIYYKNRLDMNLYKKVIDICKEHNNSYHIYTEDNIYSETLDGRMPFICNYNETIKRKEDKMNIYIVPNVYDYIDKESVYKVIVPNTDLEKLDILENVINQIDGLVAYKSAPTILDVMKEGSTKGNAVRNLADVLGIKREEIIALGDNYNDISMIEYAGFGIAMGNAEDSVKQIADVVTSTNKEDGFYNVLKEYFI